MEVMCRLIGCNEKDIASFLPKVLEMMLLNHGERSDKLILMVSHKINDGLQNNWLKTFQHVKVMKDKERLRNCYR